jgi:hypothetical protein
MLLQIAAGNIGQLTDIQSPARDALAAGDPAPPAEWPDL